MKRFFIIVISIVVIVGLIVGGYCLYKTSTPEYALAVTIEDVKSSGIVGLKEHLTSNATEKTEAVENWTNKSSISSILPAITKNSAVSFLKFKMCEVDWTVEEILKGKNRADVII